VLHRGSVSQVYFARFMERVIRPTRVYKMSQPEVAVKGKHSPQHDSMQVKLGHAGRPEATCRQEGRLSKQRCQQRCQQRRPNGNLKVASSMAQ